MSQALDVVKQAYAAWDAKDAEALRPLLHKDYKGTGPGIEIQGIDGAVQFLKDCPIEGRSENETYIEDGNRIVRIWDCVGEKPTRWRVRMAELNVVEDGKIRSNECFFDTAQFPKEVMDLMKQPAQASR